MKLTAITVHKKRKVDGQIQQEVQDLNICGITDYLRRSMILRMKLPTWRVSDRLDQHGSGLHPPFMLILQTIVAGRGMEYLLRRRNYGSANPAVFKCVLIAIGLDCHYSLWSPPEPIST